MLCILTLLWNFNRNISDYQFVIFAQWLPSFGCSLKLGVDGISMTLLLLVGIVSFAAALVSHEIHDREKEYYILFLSLTSGISGTFCTMDLFFFYFFYEMAVIPMYLMIGMWGSLPPGKHGRTKEYATMKLTLYLTAGAVLALVGLLAIYYSGGKTMDLVTLQANLKSDAGHAEMGLWLLAVRFWVPRVIIPVPHLVAPRLRRRADRGVDDARGRAEKIGGLRNYSFGACRYCPKARGAGWICWQFWLASIFCTLAGRP